MVTDNPEPNCRWLLPTSGNLLVVLLTIQAILFLAKPWIPKGFAVLIAIAAVGLFLIGMLLWLRYDNSVTNWSLWEN